MVRRKYYIKINVEPPAIEAVDRWIYVKRRWQKESRPSFHTRMAAPYPFRLLIWIGRFSMWPSSQSRHAARKVHQSTQRQRTLRHYLLFVSFPS